MTTIIVEVSDELAKVFANKKNITYDDILDYEDNLRYSFSDEKVSFNDLSGFLGNIISSKS